MPLEAKSAVFESSPEKTSLLELYSSEGCSSCPVADQWVGRLKNQKGLWERHVPVIFHVTYWDYLGWKDPFASKGFTRRQESYVSLWRRQSWSRSNPTLYTPCFVLDGKAWRGWHRFNDLPAPPEQAVGVLKIQSLADRPNDYEITFRPEKDFKKALQANIALLGFGIHSNVTRGENRGRTLSHDFVVLNFNKKELSQEAGGVYQTTVTMQDSHDFEAERYAIAVWVTHLDNPAPVQAVGGFLS